ncbi:type IV secretory system conjugative DNA transfer family protein [Mobiluncus mulieris]|uniref:type IV secretory system conjugative DNA transfer family protein n=1 Tax=Mobiluncus mulieris TaxID=2052 RepID=UPI00146FC9B2|nr:type IV secretory system conjugative DNA transfer family protein [Mobiluncus mulieris]NMW82262.1 type IV secretory system conjugative DNA transfer family protein [Mobiluncus mulieris]
MNPNQGNTDTLVNAGLALIGVLIMLWLLVSSPAVIVNSLSYGQWHWPPSNALFTLLTHPMDMRVVFGMNISPLAYWVVFVLEFFVVIALGVLGLKAWAGRRGSEKQWNPHLQPGLATRRDFRALTGKEIVKAGRWLRPAHPNPAPRDVGYLLGTSRGENIWLSIEDSCMLIGPARSGKGQNFVLPTLIEAPGAVVSTSVRAENMENTLKWRRLKGPVGVFSPTGQASIPEGVQALKWSLTQGCEDPAVAMRRASALTANSAKGVENASFWETQGQKIISPLLHAAALNGGGTRQIFEWGASPGRAEDAIRILQTHEGAAEGWAVTLDGSLHGSDPKTLANIWSQVEAAIVKPLMSPALLAALSPAEGEALNVAEFIKAKGTLYVIDDSGGMAAAFIAALVEDFYYTASRNLANQSVGNRLDPPMLLSLDELANIAKLPALPDMISAGGGSGVTTLAVLQSISQARDKWGRETAEALWGAATSRIILGGLTEQSDLEAVSKITGQRTVYKTSMSDNFNGPKTRNISEHQEQVLTPAQVRALPLGTALLISRAIAPILLDLIPHRDRDYNPYYGLKTGKHSKHK